MRRATLLLAALVLANLAAFAWWRGWLETWLDDDGGSPVARQIAPERVEPVPLARFEAMRQRARAGCWEWIPLEEAETEKLSAWVRAHSSAAEGEALRPGFRLRFAASLGDADRKSALTEAIELAGRNPVPCGA